MAAIIAQTRRRCRAVSARLPLVMQGCRPGARAHIEYSSGPSGRAARSAGLFRGHPGGAARVSPRSPRHAPPGPARPVRRRSSPRPPAFRRVRIRVRARGARAGTGHQARARSRLAVGQTQIWRARRRRCAPCCSPGQRPDDRCRRFRCPGSWAGRAASRCPPGPVCSRVARPRPAAARRRRHSRSRSPRPGRRRFELRGAAGVVGEDTGGQGGGRRVPGGSRGLAARQGQGHQTGSGQAAAQHADVHDDLLVGAGSRASRAHDLWAVAARRRK
ncbi:hypothetical protein SVIOM74S_08676 [Streptomyces violarus]